MKKSLVLNSLVFLLTGLGAIPATLPLKAETPSVISQISQNSPNSSATVGSKVQLIDPGTGQMRQLRFTPPANTKQITTMTMRMNVAGTIDGQLLPSMELPVVKLTLEALVKKVDGNGDTHIELSYSQVDVLANPAFPDNAVGQIRSQLEKIKDMKISYVMDNQGNSKNLNVVFPENLDPNVKQWLQPMLNSLEQLSSSPFPQEAIGVGAKWRVLSTLPQTGLPLKEIAVSYELLNLQDNIVTLEISTDQKADPQDTSKFNLPGLPPGIDVTVKSMAIQSSGTLTGRLDQILPSTGNMSVISNMEFAIQDPKSDEEAMVNMKSAVDITMESE